MARSYEVQNLYEWIRTSVYFIIIFSICYVFSRLYTQQQREAFKQKLQLRQMSQLFLGLVRVFHDGIIISHNEEIIFKNSKIGKTFDIKSGEGESSFDNCNNLMDILKSLEPDISV